MDWKYKHFQQERVFAAEPSVVLEAARRFMTESLGWTIRDSAEGFTAEGLSFFHESIANVRVQSTAINPPATAGGSDGTAGGTRVIIDLRVRRAGAAGFMLFDVGGYYNIQIRKWLDGIQRIIHQNTTGGEEPSPIPALRTKPGA